MIAPFVLTPGFHYDLRSLPIYLACLYGGYRTGILSCVLMLVYRYHLGGDGFYVATMCVVPAALAALYFSKTFPTLDWAQKRNRVLFVVLFENVLRTGATYLLCDNAPHYLAFTSIFCGISLITIYLAVMMIEGIGEGAKMRLELTRSDKLQVVSDLAASIAHEIRNPLTTVRGFAQLLLEDKAARDAHGVHLALMVDELDSAEEIITNYLSFSRPQMDTIQPVDVANQIRHVISLLSPYAAANSVDIRAKVCQQTVFVTGNESKLRQALVNIVKNAIEATVDRGTVHISLTCENGMVMIHIRDTGIGMTTAEVHRLGSPFYSTKSSGTGLGLMVTYQIIDKMHGEIQVESAQGCGTTFIIAIPSV